MPRRDAGGRVREWMNGYVEIKFRLSGSFWSEGLCVVVQAHRISVWNRGVRTAPNFRLIGERSHNIFQSISYW